MAETELPLLNLEFYLPTQFFSDDDEPITVNPKAVARNSNLAFAPFDWGSNLGFGPFDFAANLGSSGSSSGLSSPVESVLGSTETESEEDDELGNGLSRSFSQFGLGVNQKQRSSVFPTSTLPGKDFWARRESILPGGMTCAAVVGHVAGNGGDAEAVKGMGPPVGPVHEKQFTSPLGNPFPFPFHYVDPKIQSQIPNQNNCCSILGKPFPDDLLCRQIQLQQYLLSQHSTKVLSQIQFEENAKFVCSSLGHHPSYVGPSPLVPNQMIGVPFGGFGPKQACAGTGVFIPRLKPTTAPKRPGRTNAYNPPRMYQPVNKNLSPSSTQAFNNPVHDALTVRSEEVRIQKTDGLVKQGICLPQEWSY